MDNTIPETFKKCPTGIIGIHFLPAINNATRISTRTGPFTLSLKGYLGGGQHS